MSNQSRVIALGFFDGVHLGHGALLRRTAEEAKARGVRSAVFTFAQPPKEVVTGTPVPLINSPEDRAWLAKHLYGIDDIIMVPFDQEMMTTSWQDFITEILVKRYHAVHLVAGHDHHFGHKNQGSPELLQAKCAELGLGCDIIPEVTINGITVSSTYIRRLVGLGQVERAMEYLGHPHILTQTVQEALSEREDTIIEEEPPRRGLFSRRKMRDTEQLYDDAEKEEDEEEAFEEPEPELPEPPLTETLSDYRAQLSGATKARRGAGIFTLLLCVMAVLEHFSILPEAYTADPMIRALPLLAVEAIVCAIGWRIFAGALRSLKQGKVTSGFLTMLLCLVTLLDTALYAFLPARAALSLPLPVLGAMSVYCALLGESLRLHGMYDTFRIAAIGNAPYIVTVTAGGAAKRVGLPGGFSNSARANDPYSRWQSVLLPVFLAAAVVFGVLSTLETKQNALLAWNLSVMLASANLLAFPMVCALPLKRIAARLAKSGSAVAGFSGADAIRRSNCVILTDGDLFPPGTVTLGGLKVFGEESGKVISYAATMAHASESGLSRLFDNLLASDGGFREQVEDVDFYEEGGVGGRIHGETVLFGTAGFMRKRGVNLPRNLGLKTGVFLSVDGTLIAVFAVKYMPAENVDWALHALHHSRITPVLAVRDGNITPALLKRKFGTDARAVYPKLSTRLALSERGGGRPYALLMREGLMPYAEVVLGSKRLCASAKRCTVLAFLAATASTLLAFYLTFVGAYSVLTPFSLLIYVLLWSLSALVDALLSDRY